jgi:hypothetical protein
VINIDYLEKVILVENNRSYFSRERERWIPGIECTLMFLHRNMHTMTRDPRYNHNEVERIRHVSTMERIYMWRKNDIRSETTYRRRLNFLKEICLFLSNPLIISPSKSEILRPFVSFCIE